jgi:hypothetical protein
MFLEVVINSDAKIEIVFVYYKHRQQMVEIVKFFSENEPRCYNTTDFNAFSQVLLYL